MSELDELKARVIQVANSAHEEAQGPVQQVAQVVEQKREQLAQLINEDAGVDAFGALAVVSEACQQLAGQIEVARTAIFDAANSLG